MKRHIFINDDLEATELSLIMAPVPYENSLRVIRSMRLKHSLILRVYLALPLSGLFSNGAFPVLEAIEGNEKDLFLLNLQGRDELIKAIGLHHQWYKLRPWRRISLDSLKSMVNEHTYNWAAKVEAASNNGRLLLGP